MKMITGKKTIKFGDKVWSLPELLDVTGFSVFSLAIRLDEIDPNDYYTIYSKYVQAFIDAALVLRGLAEQLDDDWDGYMVALPHDVVLVEAVEAGLSEDTTKPVVDDDGDVVDLGGDDSSIGDFPF